MRVLRWARPVALTVLAIAVVGCAASEANGEAGGGSGADDVVAKVGDQVITAAELEAQLREQNPKAWQAWFDARKGVLDAMINQRVLDAETAARGTTVAGLQAEATKDLPPVTDAEIQAFYAANQGRMGGRSLDDMKPQIQQFLANQRAADVMGKLMTDLRKKAGVRVFIEPPRAEVKIAANDPRKGPEGAPITLVEYSDFQ